MVITDTGLKTLRVNRHLPWLSLPLIVSMAEDLFSPSLLTAVTVYLPASDAWTSVMIIENVTSSSNRNLTRSLDEMVMSLPSLSIKKYTINQWRYATTIRLSVIVSVFWGPKRTDCANHFLPFAHKYIGFSGLINMYTERKRTSTDEGMVDVSVFFSHSPKVDL